MVSPGRNLPRARTGRRSRRHKDAWTRSLWPVHLKPLPDELLSSWIVRLAWAHGLKVQTFGRLLAGSNYMLWNRDIDRIAPDWLLRALCESTATPDDVAWKTTLRSYEGVVYGHYHESYVLRWILLLNVYHRTRKGFGLQFCPKCLSEDPEPYFRRRWRVAAYTWCAIHDTMLHDRCPQCEAPIDFQRWDLGRPAEGLAGESLVTRCYHCGFDLREAPTAEPIFYEESIEQAFRASALVLECRGPAPKPGCAQRYRVMHHLCRLMHSAFRANRPMEFACRTIGVPVPKLGSKPRTLEGRPIYERHDLAQLGFWYMADLKARLTAAWYDGAVTYSALFRDFRDRPDYYDKIVARFSDWRSRPNRHVQPQGEGGRFLPLGRSQCVRAAAGH